MIPHSRPTTGEAEREAVAKVLSSGQLAQGAEVEAFEQECAAKLGWRHAVAVSSGTAALQLALQALELGPGKRVAFPDYACTALPLAIRSQNAEPAPVDVGADFNLDPGQLPERSDAVVVANLFGKRSPLPNHPLVIDDIAQSIGAPRSAAPVAVASFYATKVLTTGEGGMLFTDDSAMAEDARDRRDYDNRDDYRSRYNYKMTEFQAAMGRVQLARLDDFLSRRREIAQRYANALAGTGLVLPSVEDHIFFRYVVLSEARDELTVFLNERGVQAKRPVYKPYHRYQEAILAPDRLFPGADRVYNRAVSLPIYPSLADEEVEAVLRAILDFHK